MIETPPPVSGPRPTSRPIGLALLAFYKGGRGAFEGMVGALMLFSHGLLAEQIAKDPQGTVANWLFAHLDVERSQRIGIFIILLGAIDLTIGLGIWFGSWFLRKVALAFLAANVAFGAYDIATGLTVVKFGELILNFFLIWYFWKVLPKYLRAESDVEL